MTATEARARALEVNTSESIGQYAKVKSEIQTAANKGAYECWFYDKLKPDVEKKLIDNGFIVGPPQYDRDGTMTKISW